MSKIGRTVVIIGGDQAAAIADIYRRFFGEPGREQAVHIPSTGWSEAHRQVLSEATIAIIEIDDPAAVPGFDELRRGARRIEFPRVEADFLWPFGKQPHLKNYATPDFAGPYPAQLGDAFLNQMIAQAVPPEQAAQRYADLDLHKLVDLDRLYEACIQRQRARDRRTGFRSAELIEQHFRDEPLFRTPSYPNIRLFAALFMQICAEASLTQEQLAKPAAALRQTPFPPSELPIHPSVIAHFGLRHCNAETRYRYFSQGSYSSGEFARRYVGFEYDTELEEGIRRASSANDDETYRLLEAGVRRTPRSGLGHLMLGRVLHARGMPAAAEEHVAQAAKLDLKTAYFYAELARFYAQSGKEEEAIREFRRAIHLDPLDPELRGMLGTELVRFGHADEGILEFRKAIELDAENYRRHDDLAKQFLALGRIGEAATELQQAVALAPKLPHLRAFCGSIVAQTGDLASAEHELRQALALAPDIAHFHESLSGILARQGKNEEAIIEMRMATELSPDNSQLAAKLTDLLGASRESAASERREIGHLWPTEAPGEAEETSPARTELHTVAADGSL
jgi:Flp pilus assembly protein TadD